MQMDWRQFSLKIIVLEMYGRADPEEYLWLSGLIIEADHSKSGPAVVVLTAWGEIKTGILASGETGIYCAK